jgi:hypothetical protein
MGRYEVTHATPDGADYDRRIDYIGGPDFGGWRMTQEDAIRVLKGRFDTFYVRKPVNSLAASGYTNALFAGGNQIEVVVRSGGLLVREHLATVADGIETDNLRSLQPCPPGYRLVNSLP